MLASLDRFPRLRALNAWRLFGAALVVCGLTYSTGRADTANDPRAEVAAALKGMGDAANAHDVEGHVGYYARDPNVTLIVDGEPTVGWVAIRDKQRQWWNNGKTDVVYEIQAMPEVRVLATNVVLTTLLLKGHRTLPDGQIRENHFAVSSIWQKREEGWRVLYSHESSTR